MDSSPRRRIVQALNGNEPIDLTYDEKLVYDMVCHLEALHIFNLGDDYDRRCFAATLLPNMEQQVKMEYMKLKNGLSDKR